MTINRYSRCVSALWEQGTNGETGFVARFFDARLVSTNAISAVFQSYRVPFICFVSDVIDQLANRCYARPQLLQYKP